MKNVNPADRASPVQAEEADKPEEPAEPLEEEKEESVVDEDSQSQFTTSTAPMLSSPQYTKYIRSLIKLLVGETILNNWLKQGKFEHIGQVIREFDL